MPVLDYGPLLAPGGFYRARIAVWAVMAWPNDKEARREYIATATSVHLGDLKVMLDALPDPRTTVGVEATLLAVERHEEWKAEYDEVERWFEEAGGHASVSMAPGYWHFVDDFAKRRRDWFAAGLILALVRRMEAHHADLRGGASVNKAVFILERANLPNVPHNSYDLRRAWKFYKPVAHFCAALYDWFTIAATHNETPEEAESALEEELEENFMMFLSDAEAYLKFGISYQLPRARGLTLLDPRETWLLPQYRPWPESFQVPQPLTGALLEAAAEYRAPVPGS